MEAIIEVKNLKKVYKKRKTKESLSAVDNISFSVNRREIVGLLGPNGAGKSTTIKMICGLLIPDMGSITVNGINAQKKRLAALSHISAVLEGNRNLYWRLSVRENLEYFSGNRGLSRKVIAEQIEDLLIKFKLKEKENELVNRLSRGMQQKLAIAVAMLADTEIILLDEPTLGLDIETSYEVRELLKSIVKEYNRTIIISSHDMDVIQNVCNRTIIINHGKIVANDKVENLLSLFEVHSYKVQLGGHLTDQQYRMLIQKFPELEYVSDSIQSTLRVNLNRSKEIYDLFDVLKLEHIPVETIDRQTVNFEEVFMRILKGEKDYAMVYPS